MGDESWRKLDLPRVRLTGATGVGTGRPFEYVGQMKRVRELFDPLFLDSMEGVRVEFDASSDEGVLPAMRDWLRLASLRILEAQADTIRDYLRCPTCRSTLTLNPDGSEDAKMVDGAFVTTFWWRWACPKGCRAQAGSLI